MTDQTKQSPKKKEKEKKPSKNKGGAPTVFTSSVIEKALELYEAGRTEQQIADILNIHVDTLRKFKKRDKEFFWASREAKMIADEMVEASLFQNAIGYNRIKKKYAKIDGEFQQYEEEEHFRADTRAQIFWLKNRRPQEWKDKVEIEHRPTQQVVLQTGDDEEEEISF